MFFHPYNFVELPLNVGFLIEMLCAKTSVLDELPFRVVFIMEMLSTKTNVLDCPFRAMFLK
jgi:hypothetical protein